jgi:hypothetical protein
MTIKKSKRQSLYLAIWRLRPRFLEAAASLLESADTLGPFMMSGKYLGYVWNLIEAKAAHADIIWKPQLCMRSL